jgi:hypothetical protein
MDIFDILKKDPDQAVQVCDDKQVKLILGQLGIANAFSDEHELADVPTVQIYGFDGHKTHFVLAFVFSGLPQRWDNGYLLTFAPRSGFATGLSTADFVSGASREQSSKGLRVLICDPNNSN